LFGYNELVAIYMNGILSISLYELNLKNSRQLSNYNQNIITD
jgi:hypothetical protein